MARIINQSQFNMFTRLMKEKIGEYDEMIEYEVSSSAHYNQEDVDDMVENRDRLVNMLESLK